MEQLPRKLGMLDATLIVVGVVIGSGIFLLPGLIARNVPSAPVIMAIWIATGIVSLLGAFAYAELGAMMPATGGQYVFLREACGPACAFLSGWVFVFGAVPGGIAFLARGFSTYLGQFVALTPLRSDLVSIALIVVLSVINYIGVREGAWTQRIFGILKIAGLILLIGAAILASPALPAPARPYELTSHGVGIAVAACLMAYNGWSFVSFVAGEVKHPERNIPRALVYGMFIVMALYIGANLAYMHVLSVPEIAGAERVGALVMDRITGSAGARLLSLLVLCSIIGAINGNIMTGARIPFAQARDGLFFERFGRIHPRFKTPSFAIAVQCAWSLVLLLSGSFEALSSYTILSAWFFYVLTVGSVAILRRTRPDAPRPYRMWGYPATLWIFLAASAWYIGDAITGQPYPSFAALLIMSVGVPFYLIRTRWTPGRASNNFQPQPVRTKASARTEPGAGC
ncbi:MAG TPA: amino acid permease [Bryobacteraceae bacterium]|nr:amino acid permease [Bryobacteraceae bacterium]